MAPFPLGQILATPGALVALDAHDIPPLSLLSRHAAGDWGAISGDDRGLNEQALVTGARLLSVYKIAEDVTVWIITEAADDTGQRAATTLLLPDDY
jgi:hypothetical protein